VRREVARVRHARTGVLYVVFSETDDVGRNQILEAREFDDGVDKNHNLGGLGVTSRNFDINGLSWECTRCRKMFGPEDQRSSVVNDLGQVFEPWCKECTGPLS